MTTISRQSVRYKPERLDTAFIMYDGNVAGWHPDDCALIMDESAMTGAQLLVRRTDRCGLGSRVRVKLGPIDPILAEVVWVRDVDTDLTRLGLRFLE